MWPTSLSRRNCVKNDETIRKREKCFNLDLSLITQVKRNGRIAYSSYQNIPECSQSLNPTFLHAPEKGIIFTLGFQASRVPSVHCFQRKTPFIHLYRFHDEFDVISAVFSAVNLFQSMGNLCKTRDLRLLVDTFLPVIITKHLKDKEIGHEAMQAYEHTTTTTPFLRTELFLLKEIS